jgi:gliding motility-associated-like protein
MFTPGAVGTFTLTYTYTSAQGCGASDTRDVTVIAPNVINAGTDQTICLNTPPVQLLTGGTWAGSYVTAGGLFTPSVVGNYTLTYTTTSGQCQSTDQIIVSVKALPTVNAGTDQTICNGQTATLTATASSANGSITTYAWSGSTAVVSPGSASTTTTPTATTTYTMLVTDNVGCTASDNVIVNVNALPTVNAGNDITLCNQPIAHQLTGFSPAGGTWWGTNVTSSGVYTPAGVGSFTLTYCFTNGNGCTACDNMVVTVTTTTMANAGTDETVCVGSPAFMLTPGNTGGTWTSTPMLTSAGMFTPNAVGTYNLTYSLGSGTCLTTDVKTVFVRALPIINAGNDAGICAGNSHNINASVGASGGPFTYAWSNASTLSANNTEDVVATPTTTSTYGFTVTNTYGCVSTDNITITVVPLAVPSFNAIDTSCVNTGVTMVNTSTGAATYSWNLGNSNSSTAVNPTATYANTGLFNITLTANNSLGCSTTTTQPITILSTPSAHFSLSANEGCSPLVVAFVNESTGQNMSYSWNLDGSTSTSANPAPATYTAEIVESIYTIALTTSNLCGSNTYSEEVTVNPPPRALFNTSLSSQCSPVTTNFINASDGYPDSFVWNLGNGETNTATTPDAEVYITDASSADYTITLYAYNECGVDSTQSVVTVLPNTVNMNLMPSATYGCSPMFVEFNNFTTGATSHYFDFGDSDNSSVISPNHIYTNPGVYDLVYYANDGCSFDTTYMTIEVIPSPTIEITSGSAASCPLAEVDFDAQTTGNIASVIWNFGDDSTAVGSSVMHSYALGNTYYLSATAQATNGCEASASMEYLVYPQPVASMTATPVQSCSPVMVCTNNTSTGATQQLWSFGLAAQSTDLNPCHGFNNSSDQPIMHVVSLEVTNDFGCSDTTSQTIEVLPQPVTSFALSSYESCEPLETVNVTVNTQGSSEYQWTVNGSNYSNEMTPSFSFNEVGDYTLQVISSNSYGCTDTHEEVYSIHPLPVIEISPTPTSGCIPLEVDFINNTTNGDTYVWTFSTGATITLAQPTQTFIQEGLYDVQVEATSQFGCQSVRFFNDVVEAFGKPVANFSFTPDGDIIYETVITFEDESSGAISYNWDFGDGYISDEPSPTHHFRSGGRFYVTQTVTNEHGCTSEHTESVNIDNTYYIFVPNSFTPNDDGINDIFIPVMSDDSFIKKYEFAIMNRWGETVFYTTDPEEGWQGNTRDGLYYNHNDTFNYMVKVEFNDLRVSQMHTGSVTIIR